MTAPPDFNALAREVLTAMKLYFYASDVARISVALEQVHDRAYAAGEVAGRKAERERCVAILETEIGKRAGENDGWFVPVMEGGLLRDIKSGYGAEPAAPPATAEQPQPEPARPLTLAERASSEANALQDNCGIINRDDIADAMIDLARDFAREALRAAICTCANPECLANSRLNEVECDAAIAAAEKGEVPR